MNPTRDEILRLLLLMSLKSVDGIADIEVQNILKYSEPFEILEDLQIPYVGYVKSLIADQGSGITTLTFTQADLVDDGGGGWYLPLNLTGTQITAAVKSTNGFAKSGGDVQNVNGFTDNAAQTITVFVLGIESDEPAEMLFTNPTAINILYSLNGSSPTTLLAGDSITVTAGDNLVMALTSPPGPGTTYILINQSGPINSVTDGQPIIDTTIREFIIPIESISLEIIGSIN